MPLHPLSACPLISDTVGEPSAPSPMLPPNNPLINLSGAAHNMLFFTPPPRGFPRPAVPSCAVTGEKVGVGVGLRRLSSHLCPSAAIDPVNHHLCEKKPWAPARPAGSALPPLPRVASSLCSPPLPALLQILQIWLSAAAPACREGGQGRRDPSGTGVPFTTRGSSAPLAYPLWPCSQCWKPHPHPYPY